MAEERELKRVRQACQNCRRKKTRCSGEKPVCSFCQRLRQNCHYENGLESSINIGSSANEQTLSARVALLESKLRLLDNVGTDFWSAVGSDANTSHRNRASSAVRRDSNLFSTLDMSSPDIRDVENLGLERFNVLPPLPVLRSVTDTYFKHCHNQPYCYFEECDFRRRLDNGELPSYLLMAVIALAGRFSRDPFFRDDQFAATEMYSRSAWTEIFERSFSEEAALDVSVVQATNILAVVDFTAGKHKLAWMKIGLAVRFAQSLQLANEPSQVLTTEQQHERMLTFWSVYLLDRLVSCGHNRPPTVADDDCNLHLPSDMTNLGIEPSSDTPTLQDLYDIPDATLTYRMGHFASTIFMASVLGRVERFVMQKGRSPDHFPPWHSRSEYMTIYSLLLNFEAYSDAVIVDFATAIDEWLRSPDGVDQTRAGHLVFSIILYHMNQCLLHHPFLLRKCLDTCKTRAPPSFIKDTLGRGLEHAKLLTLALSVIKNEGLTMTSFYAYACTVAAGIHILFMQHEDAQIAMSSRQLLDSSIEFLQHGQNIWNHYPRMASALMEFHPDASSAKSLVHGTGLCASLEQRQTDPNLSFIWNMLDYGWLSDLARPASPLASSNLASGGAGNVIGSHPVNACGLAEDESLLHGMSEHVVSSSADHDTTANTPLQAMWGELFPNDNTMLSTDLGNGHPDTAVVL